MAYDIKETANTQCPLNRDQVQQTNETNKQASCITGNFYE